MTKPHRDGNVALLLASCTMGDGITTWANWLIEERDSHAVAGPAQ